MFILISLLFIPSLSYSFDVEETGKPPVITPVNDSFVKINYQEAFKIKDFSKVDKIEFYSTQPGREKSEYFALAGHYDQGAADRLKHTRDENRRGSILHTITKRR